MLEDLIFQGVRRHRRSALIGGAAGAPEQSWRVSDRQGLQVKTVQEVCGKHTRRQRRNHWAQCRVTPHSLHGEVQLMLLLRFCVGFNPGGRRSKHLTVQVIDQAQQPVRLCPEESLPDGTFEEVLQAATRTPSSFFGVSPSLTLGYPWGQAQAGECQR